MAWGRGAGWPPRGHVACARGHGRFACGLRRPSGGGGSAGAGPRQRVRDGAAGRRLFRRLVGTVPVGACTATRWTVGPLLPDPGVPLSAVRRPRTVRGGGPGGVPLGTEGADRGGAGRPGVVRAARRHLQRRGHVRRHHSPSGGLRDVGITAVELMPVAQFPGGATGDTTACTLRGAERYGGPAGLQRLVDACHARLMAVFLDVVYNHVGPEGTVFTLRPVLHRPVPHAVGAALNFDGPAQRRRAPLFDRTRAVL